MVKPHNHALNVFTSVTERVCGRVGGGVRANIASQVNETKNHGSRQDFGHETL